MTSLRRMPFALVALFTVVSSIAALAYAINAWQVFGFAHHVWQLPLQLCFGAAVVADALSLAGLFATYLLRSAPKRVRAYAWVVFLGMTGLSIAAAESFAVWRRLSPIDQRTSEGFGAQVAAGAIVVALALAVHLLIVCCRYVPIGEDPVPIATCVRTKVNEAKTAKAATATGVSAAAPRGVAPAPSARQSKRKGAAVKPDAERRDAFARRVVVDHVRAVDIAREAGVSKRSIELWAQDYRKRHGSTPVPVRSTAGFDPGPLDGIPERHVNGAAPEVGVGA